MDLSEVKKIVLEKGCFSPEENLRMFNVYFADGVRRYFWEIDKKYQVSKKKVCDAGSACGLNLLYYTKESYGIELDKRKAEFSNSLGVTVYNRNLVTDDLSDLPKVEIVWCSAVLEHVESPHRILTNLKQLLLPGGLIIVAVPTISPFRFLERFPGKIGAYVRGYKTGPDHINAFVPSTLQFTCERAGFKTIEVSPFYPGFLKVFNHLPLFNYLMGKSTYVGRYEP